MSSDLRLGPLAIAYTGLAEQLRVAGLDPRRNLWNAVFDFSSPDDCRRNWRPVSISEIGQYRFVFAGQEEASEADSLALPPASADALMAKPLESGADVGQRLDLDAAGCGPAELT
mmetsp:Transcript_80298/g.171923  ORF Transcript_80298/g.171923 Transcript_80298/m.171923 type:complete len:115 (-) Transcript_80298:45-389(-)